MSCGDNIQAGMATNDNENCRCPGSMKKFIEPCLLLFLRKKKAYGYELLDNLISFGFEPVPDPGAVYRNLRRMEEEGLVQSHWETAGSGLPRRFYELTPEGEALLHVWVNKIKKNKALLEDFIRRYHEITG